MNIPSDKELTEQCVVHWGTDAQLEMVVEECAELILAIKHMNRNSKDSGWGEVVGEMVDVEIMLAQLSHMAAEFIGISYEALVEELQNEKHRRLYDRIDRENGYTE